MTKTTNHMYVDACAVGYIRLTCSQKRTGSDTAIEFSVGACSSRKGNNTPQAYGLQVMLNAGGLLTTLLETVTGLDLHPQRYRRESRQN